MSVGYEPIVWNASLMTGVEVIDEQHKILVNMINEASDRLSEQSGREVLEQIVLDLMGYALYHFDTEEELMIENQYDELAKNQHFHEHRTFSTTVSELQQDIRQGKLISREDILTFLNHWLINHILHTDQQLGQFLVQTSPVNPNISNLKPQEK